MNEPPTTRYGLSDSAQSGSVAAPELDYLPRWPAGDRTPIALVGAGGISEHHLRAYRSMGLNVVAVCDVDRQRAERRRREFYPDASVEVDYRRLLQREDIAVIDVATHPRERLAIVTEALQAGKHVLSQKPLVTDLNDGRKLVELADRRGVKLAVNQNGRWAPHFSYLRHAVAQQLVGPLASVDFCLQWDHTWTEKTPFNEIHHLILYDFGIHWFDMTVALMGDPPAESVFASVRRSSYQTAKPPLLAQVVIDYPDAQVRMSFNAITVWGQEDRTIVVGRDGTLRAWGPGLNDQQVALWTAAGQASPKLAGRWFDSGFQGTMGELLMAIGEDREPSNSARGNLRSLQLCFAALASADRGEPVDPATVQRLTA